VIAETPRQVVQDASSGRHSRRRDDDRGTREVVERLGLLDAAHQLDVLQTEGVLAPPPRLARLHVLGLGVVHVDPNGLDGHRAVDVDRDVRRQPALGLQLAQKVQHHLGAADRECRDQDDPATLDRLGDDPLEAVLGIVVRVVAVSVGALEEQVVARREPGEVRDDRLVRRPDVAGEHHDRFLRGAAIAPQSQFHERSPQNVARGAEPELDPVVELSRLLERNGSQQAQGLARLGFGVQRQRRLVLAESLLVGPARVLFLEVARIGKDDAAQIDGRRRRQHGPVETAAHHDRQVAGVIEVSVGQHHGVDRGGFDRRRIPIALPEILEPLEQPAIDEQPEAVVLEQVLRAGDGARGAEERQSRHGGR